MDESPIHKRKGAYLPHWTRKGAIYAVCFRLADSVPQKQLKAWQGERDDIINTAKTMKRPLSSDELERLRELSSDAIHKYLRNGCGECYLRRDDIAGIVADALRFFEGVRYRLFAWCIMPNHVHVVVQPLPDFSLSSILHSWKSFTSKKANAVLGREGRFWNTEYYDHLIRHDEELRHHITYAWKNPDAAGLKNWKWRWVADGIQSESDLSP